MVEPQNARRVVVQPSALGGLFGLGSRSAPITYEISFTGQLNGATIEGVVTRYKDGEPKTRASLLSINENEFKVLMILSEDGQKINVMEKKANESSRFYELKAYIEPVT